MVNWPTLFGRHTEWAWARFFFGWSKKTMVAQVEDTQDAMAPGTLPERVAAEVRPLLAAEGYDLILVEHSGSSGVLRLFIDSDKPGGVGIDDCTKVSRWVSDLLDGSGMSDAIPGAYRLEVSSPGLDRPLARPADFCRFISHEVKLTLLGDAAQEFDGRRRFSGVLREADESVSGGIRIEVDEKVYALRYETIEQARLVPEL